MISHSTQSKDLNSGFAPQLQLTDDTCPSCGQAIPADRLEEMTGKIAAREREQALVISNKLEQQFLVEKARTEAKAKADLELERRQSTERYTQGIEKMKSEAQAILDAKLAEAEQARQKLFAADQKALEESATARRFAEEKASALQADMLKLQQTNANALQAVKDEALARESEIRSEAQKAADDAVAARITKLEAERQASESALQLRLKAAEEAKIAAEQKEATLLLQMNSVRADKDAEIVKIKEAAATEAGRIRQEVAQTAAAQFQATITDKDKMIAVANAKAVQAEQSLQTLTQQHEQALMEKLSSQREVLEQAKEAAVNAEKAKAFEENQKLSTKISELQRAMEKKTSEELGEGAEIDLFEALRKEFQEDNITRISKGAPGADVLQVVMLRGKQCGMDRLRFEESQGLPQ